LRDDAAMPSETDFLAGGGAMGLCVRAHDWATTPLGPIESWPQSLRTAVGMVLASRFPACIVWGPGLVSIHNDAFRPILGAKPDALGRPFNEIWSEVWEEVGPIAERAFAGEATFVENLPLTVERNGYPEEAAFTFCYSPVRDEAGRVAGFLDTVIETTGTVLTKRRQAFLLHLEERLRGLADARETTLAAAEALARHLGAARAGYGEIDATGETVVVERDWTDGTVASLAGGARLMDAFGPAVTAELHAGRILVVEDCLADPRAAGGAYSATWASIGTRSLVVVPLLRAGRLRAILYLHEPEPRRWGAAEVDLAKDIAQRTWAAVERARAETALRESEERFRLMADAVPLIVWITDTEGRNEFYNEQWFNYTGAPRGPITAAETVASYIHPDDAGPTMQRFEEARRTGEMFLVEHRIRSKAGEWRWFLVRGEPQRDARTGRVLRWFGASVDIHDRKNAEEANARLAAIIASTSDAVIAFAAEDGRIVAWNKGAEELFGYIEAEALGRPVGLLVPPDLPEDEPTGVFRRAMEGARVHEHETMRVAKSGERIPVAVTASRMLAPDGRAIGVAGIFRDLRQRKVAEARQALLSREVDHRAKNVLAVVQAALRLTRAPDLPSYVRAITGRVAALARAQMLLADERWVGADLRTLLTNEMEPFLSDDGMSEPRATLAGPTVALPAGAAQPLAMAVHELATNATKHGALSVPGGRVAVAWSLDGGRTGTLRLHWAEAGGPPVIGSPTRRGFGTRVLDTVVRGQLGGEILLVWNTSGLVCNIELPLARMAGGSAGDLVADQAGFRHWNR
jgi:PAS domain S-box-containing protein